jgi:acyl carrier protein
LPSQQGNFRHHNSSPFFMDSDLKSRLKNMMVTELMLQVTADEIGDDTPVFGPEGLGLDSVDALQLVVALEKQFGLKVNEGPAAREILRTVNTMSAAIEAKP